MVVCVGYKSYPNKLTTGMLVLRELFMMGPYTFDMLCQENSVFDLK